MATYSKTMVGVLVGAGVMFALSSLSSGALSSEATPKQQDGVFVHIAKGPEHAHAALMALQMAQIMSKDKNVLVYVDVKGIDLLLKTAPDLQMEPFDSSRTAIKKLIAKGVPVLACPGCLKAAHKKPEDLMPGVKIATKEAFFGFTPGRILTLDY